MSAKAKKVVNVVTTVLTVIAVCVALFTVVSVLTVNKTDRSLLGYRFYVCLSDSMKATDFAAGDLVVSKKIDLSKLKEGDIISFVSKDPSSNGQTVTHKIKAIEQAEGLYFFTTYGTTTGEIDHSKVEGVNVLGKYKFHIPKMGLFFNFVKTTPGYICCVFIPFMFLIVLQLVNTISIFRAYKKQEIQALKDEKAAVEKQRIENEQMLKELAAFKAKMEASGQLDAVTAEASGAETLSAESAERAGTLIK